MDNQSDKEMSKMIHHYRTKKLDFILYLVLFLIVAWVAIFKIKSDHDVDLAKVEHGCK